VAAAAVAATVVEYYPRDDQPSVTAATQLVQMQRMPTTVERSIVRNGST